MAECWTPVRPLVVGVVLLLAANGGLIHDTGARLAAGEDVIQSGPVIAQSTHFVVLCEGGMICDSKAPPNVVAHRNKEAQLVATKADAILAWFAELGFGPLLIDTHAKKFALVVREDGRCKQPDTIACHSRNIFLGYRVVFLEERGILAGSFSGSADPSEGDTIAHELSHGIPPQEPAPGVLWLHEAMGDAIGRAWTSRPGGARADLGYPLSLDLEFPRPAGARAGYEKAAYLEFVGRKLGSRDLVAYLAPFLLAGNDQQRGMSYLYDLTDGQTFDALFPEFVAGYNSFEATNPPTGDYYDRYRRESLQVPDPRAPYSQDFVGSVPAFAAEPMHVQKLAVAVPGPVADPENWLMVAEYDLASASARIDDLQLVYEHAVAVGRKHRFLFAGDASIDGGFVRVTNAGATAAATVSQGYQLTFRASPVAFTMPFCVPTGGTAEIEVEGDLSGATNWRLTPRAGTIKGVTFTAPAQPGPVAVELEITSQITRQEGTLAPATPSVRTIALGEIEVHRGDCDIRMEFEGEGMALTYSLAGDFVEYSYPDGNRIYMGDSRLAAYLKGKWVSMPAGAEKMLLGMFGAINLKAMFQTPPWAQPDPHMTRRVPKVFSDWYEWGGVTRHLHPGVPASKIGTPVSCPFEGKGCVRLSHTDAGRRVEMTYNDKRKIVLLTVDGRSILFSYGAMNLTAPPGWK